MKASELQIGDKVKVNEEWSEVKAIVDDGDVLHIKHSQGEFAIIATQEISVQKRIEKVTPPESQL